MLSPAKKGGGLMPPVHTLMFHWPPLHPDEHFVNWARKRFPQAEEKYPGIATAKVAYLGTGGQLPDGKTATDYEAEGVLLFGVGRGKFDEHPGREERKRGDCTASLFAKDIGIADYPAVADVLDYIIGDDLHGNEVSPKLLQPLEKGPRGIIIRTLQRLKGWDFSNQLKIKHRRYQDSPEYVMDWSEDWLDDQYWDASQWVEAEKEFEAKAQVEQLEIGRGEQLKMAVVVSDHELMSVVARHQGAAVVVQFHDSGHFQIYSNKNRVDLRDVIRILRLYSYRAKGELPATMHPQVLEQEGRLPGVEELWYHEAGQAIFNGSLTAPDVPPTVLSRDKILEVVRFALHREAFDPDRSQHCLKGVCVHDDRNICPLFNLGLLRCREIRYHQHHEPERASAQSTVQTPAPQQS